MDKKLFCSSELPGEIVHPTRYNRQYHYFMRPHYFYSDGYSSL